GSEVRAAAPQPGPWHAWLDSPGGELPFGLELGGSAAAPMAFFLNGKERIAVPRVSLEGNRVVFDIDHYDSKIVARVSDGGKRLDGEWAKRGRNDAMTRMAFHAVHGRQPQFRQESRMPAAAHGVDGRWAVKFSSSNEPAVGAFKTESDGSVSGTFLTTTGDYRYLAGGFDGTTLRLSCFDGGHAFLFVASMGSDDVLTGDFWSRDAWHETWTGKRDDSVQLPDAFSLTRGTKVSLSQVAYRDLKGRNISLGDARFQGKARIIEVFGTWCPNCHDASDYLAELNRKYKDRGLSIVGIAFELSNDFDRSVRQVHTFAKRHNASYPILIGGLADREKADSIFPLIDRVRSYPTFVFLNRRSGIEAVYSGFSGPATGSDYDRLRERWESLIQGLLSDNIPDHGRN
ncbi:MAG: TlpA disulfide reductase family protein, partial [Phycisphaerae bacterium]